MTRKFFYTLIQTHCYLKNNIYFSNFICIYLLSISIPTSGHSITTQLSEDRLPLAMTIMSVLGRDFSIYVVYFRFVDLVCCNCQFVIYFLLSYWSFIACLLLIWYGDLTVADGYITRVNLHVRQQIITWEFKFIQATNKFINSSCVLPNYFFWVLLLEAPYAKSPAVSIIRVEKRSLQSCIKVQTLIRSPFENLRIRMLLVVSTCLLLKVSVRLKHISSLALMILLIHPVMILRIMTLPPPLPLISLLMWARGPREAARRILVTVPKTLVFALVILAVLLLL